VRIHIERLDHIEDVDELTFAAVQLAPPDLIEMTATNIFEWQPAKRAIRIHDIRNILNALRSLPLARKPDVVIFPEYSVPPSAFERDGLDWIDFQKYSSEGNCIVIAGSYFDVRPGKTFRNNLCHVFLPSKELPITISKAEASPQEKKILNTISDLPNAVRLLWKAPGQDIVSINVFLCRDYLSPFEKEHELVRTVSEQSRNWIGTTKASTLRF
jgi:hypothetical protein